jgi:hypothetical protein|tara:strand:+ start:5754 stop:7133 length:1380 start_codon:yes stop_codon:yes gene_type:complete
MVYPSDLPLSATSVAVFEDGLSPEYDITWSFTYQLTNYDATDEFGFCMFLQDSSYSLSGGGVGLDLGYSGGTEYAPISAQGMQGGVLGIGIDSLGVFAANTEYSDSSLRDGLSSGLSANSITVRGTGLSGERYDFITTAAISAFDIKSNGPKTLRAGLGNYGRKLRVDYKAEADTFYTNILNVDIPKVKYFEGGTFRPGVTIIKPLTSNNTNGNVIITNFHVEGNTAATTTSSISSTPMVPFEPVYNSLGDTPQSPPLAEAPQRLPFLGIEPAIGCPDVYCGLSATGGFSDSGTIISKGHYPNTFLYSISAFIGDVQVQWASGSNPYRFIYEYDSETKIDTGFVGSRIFNYGGTSRQTFRTAYDNSNVMNQIPGSIEAPAPDGYPFVRDSLSASLSSFYKATDKSRLTVSVYAPLSTSDWVTLVGCPYYTLSCGNEDSYLCGLTRQHEALRKVVFPNIV